MTITLADNETEEYSLHLARFTEKNHLVDAGSAMFRRAEGVEEEPVIGQPGESGLGVLHSGHIETAANIWYYGDSGQIVHEVESGTTVAIGFPGDEVLFRGFEASGSSDSIIRKEEFSFSVNREGITIDNTDGSIKTLEDLVNRLNLDFRKNSQLRNEVYATIDGGRLVLRSRSEDVIELEEIEGTPLQDWGILSYTQVTSTDGFSLPDQGTFFVNGVEVTIEAWNTNTDVIDAIRDALSEVNLENRIFVREVGDGFELYTNDGTALILTDGKNTPLVEMGIFTQDRKIDPEQAPGVTLLNRREAEGALKVLRDMEYYLRTNDFERISAMSLAELDEELNTLVRVRSQAKARTLRMETHLTRFDDFSVNLKRLLSINEDIDVAEVVMQLQEHENVYQMALAAAARAMQPTLFDFYDERMIFDIFWNFLHRKNPFHTR